ncbi:IclR family transcriptional regulator [Paraburkholderia bannensis]|uniref:IclR family transcriptional regulator n=1 Tax=Paraburkholderia bannensis TaxID=765414 RepID=UPI002AB77206|nr:IclR family transcriptional regulator [Paraburkholderia bannensis]
MSAGQPLGEVQIALPNAPVERLTVALRPTPGAKVVTPLVRALALIAAFGPQERWLGNGQLAQRTGLPPSTVSRITQSLASLGYLRYDSVQRKYRLCAAVLGLGYPAIAHSAIQRLAAQRMAAFAHQHGLHVCLAVRDRLDLVVLECRRSVASPFMLPLHVGMRVGIALSPMGWSLLAALPELERSYLLENVERRTPRDWARLRRRVLEGIAQVGETGYCTAIGEWEPELGILAASVLLEGNAPFVLVCIGASRVMSRARVARELGPRLLAMAHELQSEFNAIGH